MQVTGDLPWDKPVVFREAPGGVWKGVCEGLQEGCFRYSFIVDGVKVQDPKAPLSAEQASVFTKGSGYVKDVPHGAVAQRYYYSKNLGQMRRLHLWTPAGYEKNSLTTCSGRFWRCGIRETATSCWQRLRRHT